VPELTLPIVAVGEDAPGGALDHVTEPSSQPVDDVGRTTPPEGDESETNIRSVAELTVEVPIPLTSYFIKKSFTGEPSVCSVVAAPKLVVAEPWMMVASSVGEKERFVPPPPPPEKSYVFWSNVRPISSVGVTVTVDPSTRTSRK
jgi:hypothetical protein